MPEEAVLLTSVPVVVDNGVPLQVVFPGPYNLKATLPLGDRPPETVAESEIVPPAGTLPDGVVEMARPGGGGIELPAHVLTWLVSIVTAPVCAYKLPVLLAAVLSVTEVLARMFPRNSVPEPTVALLPTCQLILLPHPPDPPLTSTTAALLAVVNELVI